jgi:L-iditol 2-dehydrogenase
VIETAAVRPGDYVYVSGPGTIGQIVAQLAKAAGAHVTLAGTGADTDRLRLARAVSSADETIDVTKEDALAAALRVTAGQLYDAAFECAGAPQSAGVCLDVVRKRGQFIQVGLYGKSIQYDMDKALVKEVHILNSYASERTSWITGLRLLSQSKLRLEPLVSNIYPLSEWEAAFAAARDKTGFKVLLRID